MHRRMLADGGGVPLMRLIGNQRGGLLLALLLTVALGVLGSPFLTLEMAEHRLQGRSSGGVAALAAAEAGVELALVEFNYGGADFTSADGWSAVTDLQRCPAASGGCVERAYAVTKNAHNDVIGTANIFIKGFDTDTPTVISTGSDLTKQVSTISEVTLSNPFSRRRIEAGLFADWRVVLYWGGSRFDSYRSSVGAYNPTDPSNPLHDPAAPVNQGFSGDIGSNGNCAYDPSRAFIVLSADHVVNGTVAYPSDSAKEVPVGWAPTGGYVLTPDRKPLPPVKIPPALQALSYSQGSGLDDGAGHTMTDRTGLGDYVVGWGSEQLWRCDGAYRLRSLAVTGGARFEITDNCQLYLDAANADGTPALTPESALVVNGSGGIYKMGTGTTKIFMRGHGGGGQAHGITYDDSIAVSERKPERLQIYVSCPKGCPDGSGLNQIDPFYGVFYSETDLWLVPGSMNGQAYDSHYYGAFVSMKETVADGALINGEQYETNVHFDEDLKGLMLNGTGTRPTRVTITSWKRQEP